MSSRELIIARISERITTAFTKGDLIDAQNMNAFLSTLEDMSNAEYEACSADEYDGAIS